MSQLAIWVNQKLCKPKALFACIVFLYETATYSKQKPIKITIFLKPATYHS